MIALSLSEAAALIFAGADPNATVALGAHREGSPKWFCPLRVCELDLAQQAFAFAGNVSTYWCLNPFHPGLIKASLEARWDQLASDGHTRYFACKDDSVAWLSALFVDIDCGRPGDDLSAEHAIERAIGLAYENGIPWPSVVAESGRGAYVIWLIKPEPATAAARRLWDSVSRELRTRLGRLGLPIDPNASNEARWLKTPGSIARSSNGRLDTMAQYYKVRRPEYVSAERRTLKQIAGQLELDGAGQLARKGLIAHAPKGDRKRRRSRPGQGAQPRIKRAYEIELLNKLRGGMPEGCRAMTLFFYTQAYYFARAIALRSEPNGRDRARLEAREAARRLNDTFRPPLAESELQAAMSFSAKAKEKGARYTARNETVSAALRVTTAEVRAIESTYGVTLACLLPASLRLQRQQESAEEERQARAPRAQRRRFVDERLMAGVPSGQVVDEARRHGLKVGHRYVSERRSRLLAGAGESPSAGAADAVFDSLRDSSP